MGGEADRKRLGREDEESDQDDYSLKVGPLGKRTRGKLPPQAVFKHITFSEKQVEQSKLKNQ